MGATFMEVLTRPISSRTAIMTSIKQHNEIAAARLRLISAWQNEAAYLQCCSGD